MPIDLKMPALSPAMEEGTLAKWLVKEGDIVASGDLLAEIETEKATMEFEAVDEGTIAKILVPEGAEDLKVGTVIALITGDEEDSTRSPADKKAAAMPAPEVAKAIGAAPVQKAAPAQDGDHLKAHLLAKRLAAAQGIDLNRLNSSGPNGRIIKADLAGAKPGAVPPAAEAVVAKPAPAPAAGAPDIPHEAIKLSSMRKVIARRLTESKQTVPHIYLTVDIHLDALLKLRTEFNTALESLPDSRIFERVTARAPRSIRPWLPGADASRAA